VVEKEQLLLNQGQPLDEVLPEVEVVEGELNKPLDVGVEEVVAQLQDQ